MLFRSNHERYFSESVQQSREQPFDIPSARWFMQTGPESVYREAELLHLGNLADAIGNQNGSPDAEDIKNVENFPVNEPRYFATQVTLPFDSHAWSHFGEPVSRTLTADSSELFENGLELTVQKLSWRPISSPSAVPKTGDYIVIGVERGYVVNRCPTSEHVLEEGRTFAITDFCLSIEGNLKPLKIQKSKYGTSFNDPAFNGNPPNSGGIFEIDNLERHYKREHRKR